MFKKTLTLLMLSLYSACVFSEEPTILEDGGVEALFFDVESVKIIVDDQVDDGCMPNPELVEMKMEAELRRNGFDVVESYSSNSAFLGFTAVGYRQGDSCIFSYSLRASRIVFIHLPVLDIAENDFTPTIHPVEHELYAGVSSVPFGQSQKKLEDNAESAVSAFFIFIDKSKRHIKNNFLNEPGPREE